MDTIAFTFQLEKNETKDPKNVFEPEYDLDVQTYINGEILELKPSDNRKRLFINLPYLERALEKTQEFPLFVCGCGDEGCAGIFNTPLVKVSKRTITWEIYEPVRKTFVFKKHQLCEAILNLKKEMLKFRHICVWKKVAYTGVTYANEFFYNLNPNRKVIKAIAHNFAQYFLSCMNYSNNGLGYLGDYVCQKLAQSRESHFFMDILNHKIKPEFFEKDEKFMDDLKYCGKSLLEYLFESYNFPNFDKIVQSATMEIFFDMKYKETLVFFEKRTDSTIFVNCCAKVKITDENHKIYENCRKDRAILVSF